MAKPVTAVSKFYERTRTPNVSESWNSRPPRPLRVRGGTAQMKKNLIVEAEGEISSSTLGELKQLPDFYHFLKSNS